MINAVIIAILVIILLVAAKGAVGHFKGEGGCCGGGGSVVKEPDKKLGGPVIKTKVIKIDGMTCENCTNRVKRGINRIDGASAKLNLKKKQAIVDMDRDIPDEMLTSAVEQLGYRVVEIK